MQIKERRNQFVITLTNILNFFHPKDWLLAIEDRTLFIHFSSYFFFFRTFWHFYWHFWFFLIFSDDWIPYMQATGLHRYNCECGRSYNRESNLLRHKRYECGKLPTHWCELCSYTTYRKNDLQRHEKKHHS